MSGFKKFLIRGNLIELAVAFVMGAAFNGLVQDFVKSFISPLLALAGGTPNYTDLKVTIHHTPFPYGVFLTAALSFLITAAVIYFVVVLPATKLTERMRRNEVVSERACPECLSDIPVKATRCKFCTAEVQPLEATAPAHQPVFRRPQLPHQVGHQVGHQGGHQAQPQQPQQGGAGNHYPPQQQAGQHYPTDPRQP